MPDPSLFPENKLDELIEDTFPTEKELEQDQKLDDELLKNKLKRLKKRKKKVKKKAKTKKGKQAEIVTFQYKNITVKVEIR